MRPRGLIVGTACGLALGAGVIAALDAGTEPAGAQGGFTVSAAQLKINQNISSAAVKRGNRALNYLAPVRTATTDNADTGSNGVKPLSQIPGSGQGWTSSQIGNEAINSEKIAPGGVTNGDLADNAVTGAKIDAGAVGAGDLANGAVTREKVAPGVLPMQIVDAPPGPLAPPTGVPTVLASVDLSQYATGYTWSAWGSTRAAVTAGSCVLTDQNGNTLSSGTSTPVSSAGFILTTAVKTSAETSLTEVKLTCTAGAGTSFEKPQLSVNVAPA